MRSASPPASTFNTYTCGASSPSRFAEKASRLPSGLHAAPDSAPRLCVNRRGGEVPSVAASHRSLACSFGSYAGSVTEKTTRVPSGLSTGAPTRFISHTSSCVMARGAAAGVAGAAANATKPIRINLTPSNKRFMTRSLRTPRRSATPVGTYR